VVDLLKKGGSRGPVPTYWRWPEERKRLGKKGVTQTERKLVNLTGKILLKLRVTVGSGKTNGRKRFWVGSYTLQPLKEAFRDTSATSFTLVGHSPGHLKGVEARYLLPSRKAPGTQVQPRLTPNPEKTLESPTYVAVVTVLDVSY